MMCPGLYKSTNETEDDSEKIEAVRHSSADYYTCICPKSDLDLFALQMNLDPDDLGIDDENVMNLKGNGKTPGEFLCYQSFIRN